MEEAILQCIDERAEVMDSARSSWAISVGGSCGQENRGTGKAESMIVSNSVQKMLQDAIITIRNNRYVIPVKQEYRSNFGGIIHDQSGSGATSLLSRSIVAMNNKLRELRQTEEREIEKILAKVTAIASEHDEELYQIRICSGQVDFFEGAAWPMKLGAYYAANE